MASEQTGTWSLELSGNREWTVPLPLQRDLHVTRATMTPTPGVLGRNCASVWVKINHGGKEWPYFSSYCGEELCSLGNRDSYTMRQNMDKVFLRGDSVSFEMSMGRGVPGVVLLEGHFASSSETLTLKAQPTAGQQTSSGNRKANHRRVYKKNMADEFDDFYLVKNAAPVASVAKRTVVTEKPWRRWEKSYART